MNNEFESLRNNETLAHVNPHAEERLPVDTLPVHRSPLLTAPENQPFCELLQESEHYLKRWHAILSAPDYLVEHTKDEKKETWLRGFDIVQSGANLQVVPLAKEQQERPEGGVVRIKSNSVFSNEYKPYVDFFVPVGNGEVQVATLTDPDSKRPLDSFYVAVENLQEQDSALTDPYNNQPLISFYIFVSREYFGWSNLKQQTYNTHLVSQSYDTPTHRSRDYSAHYSLKGSRLRMRRDPRTKSLSADHGKALLGLVASLMPQSAVSFPDEGKPMAQQEETHPNEM